MGSRIYTQDERLAIAREVCEIVSNGTITREACTQAGVNLSTFMLWTKKYDEIDEMWKDARTLLLESWANDIIDIAENGEFTYKDSNDERRVDSGAIQLAKLQIDSRKWLLARLHPKVYGDRIKHANDDDNPIQGAVIAVMGAADVSL